MKLRKEIKTKKNHLVQFNFNFNFNKAKNKWNDSSEIEPKEEGMNRKFSPYPNNYSQPPPTSASPALLFSFSPISGLSLLFFSLFLFFVDKLLFNLHSKTQNMWENHCIHMSWFAVKCSNKITNFPPTKKIRWTGIEGVKRRLILSFFFGGGDYCFFLIFIIVKLLYYPYKIKKKNHVQGFIRISFYYKYNDSITFTFNFF